MAGGRIALLASIFTLGALLPLALPAERPEAAPLLVAASGAIALVMWITWAVHRMRRRRVEREVDGIEIPLVASFAGVRGVPLLALASNSLAPYLRLGTTHMVHGLGLQRSPYGWIKRVDAVTLPATRNLIFVWHGSPATLVANVASDAARLDALRGLDDLGVPLAPSARQLLAAAGAAPRR